MIGSELFGGSGSRETVDGRGFLRFLGQVVRGLQDAVGDQVKSLRSAHPDRTADGIADLINYSQISEDFARVMRSQWEKIRRDSPFVMNGGLSPALVELLFRHILQTSLMAEAFPSTTGRFPREEVVLSFLFNDAVYEDSPDETRDTFNEMMKLIQIPGREVMAEEVLRAFRQKFCWKVQRSGPRDFLTASLYGSINFLHVRRLGLFAKLLFNDGVLTSDERKSILSIQAELLRKMLYGLVSMAHADGRLSPEEKEFIPHFCEHFKLIVPTLNFYEYREEAVEELREAFTDPEQKTFFLSCLRDVLEADGHSADTEKRLLAHLQ
jgi:hypothetical protein